MSRDSPKVIRSIKALVLAGLVGWGVFAWWTLREARRAGAVLGNSLTAEWPEQRAPQPGTRRQLLDAAENLEAGEFRAVVLNLGPAKPPTSDEKIAAERFFAQSQALRKRFLAAASAAETEETDGADVGVVRNALARALAAAAGNDALGVAGQVELAERALEELGIAGERGSVAGDAETVAALARRIEPAFQLGRELMTEGQASVEKLVARASWHAGAEEHRKAASLLNLAAALLGVEPSGPAATAAPEWFSALAQPPGDSVGEAEAGEAVELAEAIATSLSPSEAVTGLVKKARRELAAGRPAEAQWWASTALAAMGMTEEAIAPSEEAAEGETIGEE